MQGADLTIGSNLGLSVLLMDTYTCGLMELVTEPAIFERPALTPEHITTKTRCIALK